MSNLKFGSVDQSNKKSEKAVFQKRCKLKSSKIIINEIIEFLFEHNKSSLLIFRKLQKLLTKLFF